VLLVAPIALELLRQALGMRFGVHRLFFLDSLTPWMTLLVVLSSVLAVATPIKIWNSARIEHRLQEQEKLLLAAKIEALKSQINPHFLFNTLASISSLIRSQPDTARTLIIKLSGLLRRLIRSHQHFVTLREELESIDEYLDIEVVRFGPKLQVRKEISPDTMDVIVPSMILQPLVENSIKHGLARKVGPGSIVIRSWREHGRAVIEIEDDGMGFLLERLEEPMASGIGLANVRERLHVIYGATHQLTLSSEPGRGTRARIEIPELLAAEPITA
jgi:two-component system LytT family sensor kinase